MGLEALAVVDVQVDGSMRGLVLTPRDMVHTNMVLSALRRVIPSRPRRSARGIHISAEDAHLLVGWEVPGVDLRWREGARQFVENRSMARAVHERVLGAVHRLMEEGIGAARTTLATSFDTGPLDDHQVVNVAAMTLPDAYGLCLFDEQGAGKTVSCIYAFDLLVERGEVDRALIVAPKSMVPEWKRDISRFMDDLYRVETLVGSRRSKRDGLRSQADVLVAGYETAVAMETSLTALLRREGQRFLLIVDESFNVKNLDAKRTQTIRRLREYVPRAYVLCGTPAPNAPSDVIEQFNIADYGITFDGFLNPEDVEASQLAVSRRIEEQGLYLRHLKQNVLPDLPEKRFHRIRLPLQPRQAELYEAGLREFIVELETVDDHLFHRRLSTFLARRSALLQICSHPGAVAHIYDETPAKAIALDALLNDLIATQREKVVVWSYYRYSLEFIFNRYQRYNPVRYDGSVTDVQERRAAIERFQDDDETMIFLANPAAAGAGLTLHRARIAIYESLSNQGAHYLQSIDRIHRRGQERGVEYYVLLCQHTLEEGEYQRLLSKERRAQQLLGDPRPVIWSRDVMLREAIDSLELLRQSEH